MTSLTMLNSTACTAERFLVATGSPTPRVLAPRHPEHPELVRCKRRIQLAQLSGTRPTAVARRNERERNRVRLVNLGFATLRNHVPVKGKKMSKVDTLRSAVAYIKQLQELLGHAHDNLGGTENALPDSPAPSFGSEDPSCDDDEQLVDFASWF